MSRVVATHGSIFLTLINYKEFENLFTACQSYVLPPTQCTHARIKHLGTKWMQLFSLQTDFIPPSVRNALRGVRLDVAAKRKISAPIKN